jgi:hypothetical protein
MTVYGYVRRKIVDHHDVVPLDRAQRAPRSFRQALRASLTPGPPPFSSINAAKARRTASPLATVRSDLFSTLV